MYNKGQGVPQDFAEAAEWYRRAAEQGHADAQFNLGFLYVNGQGIPQNYAESSEWYRRAAEQGYADAQYNLGAMYAKGQGVSRDLVITYALSSLSAAQGNEGARDNRDLALESLNHEQVTEGQRLASEWQVGTPVPTSKDSKTWP
jgi:TPR repeat protein